MSPEQSYFISTYSYYDMYMWNSLAFVHQRCLKLVLLSEVCATIPGPVAECEVQHPMTIPSMIDAYEYYL